MSDPSFADSAFDPTIWLSLSLAGIFFGALLRAFRRSDRWPVGDSWP
ncbi:MAG TPA: hypothetical protein VFL97_09215 [Nitrococcus sp.]|nr:hypothetical protein [Nitrococcus sp.]